MSGGIEGLAIFFGGEVELGGRIELAALILLSFFLETAELGGFFLAAANEARFLQLQIAKLFFVCHVGVQIDQAGPESVFVIVEEFGEFHAPLRIDGHLERWNTIQTPGDGGEGMDQSRFLRADGAEFAFKGGDVALVGGGIIGGEEDGAAGESGLDSIQ